MLKAQNLAPFEAVAASPVRPREARGAWRNDLREPEPGPGQHSMAQTRSKELTSQPSFAAASPPAPIDFRCVATASSPWKISAWHDRKPNRSPEPEAFSLVAWTRWTISFEVESASSCKLYRLYSPTERTAFKAATASVDSASALTHSILASVNRRAPPSTEIYINGPAWPAGPSPTRRVLCSDSKTAATDSACSGCGDSRAAPHTSGTSRGYAPRPVPLAGLSALGRGPTQRAACAAVGLAAGALLPRDLRHLRIPHGITQ